MPAEEAAAWMRQAGAKHGAAADRTTLVVDGMAG
jgi:hypothetical protein